MDKLDVVAAIIIKDNKFFIAQRNKNKHMGLSWEFPGGKVERGETFEIALKREIKEELNINVEIIDLQSLRPLDTETIINSVKKIQNKMDKILLRKNFYNA